MNGVFQGYELSKKVALKNEHIKFIEYSNIEQ